MAEGRDPVPEKAQDLKSLYKGSTDNTGVGLEVTVRGTTVEVKKAMTSDMTLKIQVPQQAAVQISETSWQTGYIHVQNVEGEVRIKANASRHI